MNGNSNATACAVLAGNQAQRVSPCDEAYDQLQAALASHEGLLDSLFARLAPALSDPLPKGEGSSGPTPVESPVRSELHGRLVGTMKRIRQQNNALADIIERLTV